MDDEKQPLLAEEGKSSSVLRQRFAEFAHPGSVVEWHRGGDADHRLDDVKDSRIALVLESSSWRRTRREPKLTALLRRLLRPLYGDGRLAVFSFPTLVAERGVSACVLLQCTYFGNVSLRQVKDVLVPVFPDLFLAFWIVPCPVFMGDMWMYQLEQVLRHADWAFFCETRGVSALLHGQLGVQRAFQVLKGLWCVDAVFDLFTPVDLRLALRLTQGPGGNQFCAEEPDGGATFS